MELSAAHVLAGLLLLWAGGAVRPARADDRGIQAGGHGQSRWPWSLRDLVGSPPAAADGDGVERTGRAERAADGRKELSTAYIKKILAKHNNYRASVSPPAANMRYMTWDAELARMAQSWADRCQFAHGGDHGSSVFEFVGQNLFTTGGEESKPPLPGQFVSTWHSEVANYEYNTHNCRGTCGHYTQVVNADTHRIGCGMNFCRNFAGRNEAWFVVCNYGPAGNVYGEKPYISGDTCSKCSDEGPFCRQGLCDDCSPRTNHECACTKICKNCGTLDENRCTCSCPNGFRGPDCGDVCRDTHEYCHQNPGWPDETFCDFDPMVPVGCPLMCGVCKAQDRNYSCANPNGSGGGSRPVSRGGGAPKPQKSKKKKKKKGKKNKKKGRGKKKKGRRPN